MDILKKELKVVRKTYPRYKDETDEKIQERIAKCRNTLRRTKSKIPATCSRCPANKYCNMFDEEQPDA